MPTVTYLLSDGSQISADLPVGTTLLAGAVNSAVPGVLGDCGGSCSCATCHVYVEERRLGELEPPSVLENELLDGVAAPRRENSRLSCQICMTHELNGLIVTLPDVQA
ncbi:2Fe-2S iron-sulfur cluster-binding protein [Bradyrhizobium sp. AS23.2]|uniref:2Fe-2S iron-sulfur cluster-binding protein n=1 Tax=Bradyrhizobium sp. AS23.2 TaxID=1680155 RepID=UPI00093B02B8|nr:2Fe-2S iron-sulfur cluster-binding protein [Bradyrhizobium sp. AS23.2]OKO83898.1 hypothetical protein AC630_10305 [Bradyrhizobium sp. AS23.2]